jgi:ATP-dependent HslUV protease ATP-binding subunit HslU
MDLSPKEVVEQLDKYIIGQSDAKRAVAVALRNRYRRSQLSKDLKDEITPKNIILKGPTGVGKTEIARRLAKLVNAPFIKVEATKFTEVGYVGRDVESMIRDLVEVSVRLVKDEMIQKVEEKIKPLVENKILNFIYEEKVKEEKDKPDFSSEKLKEEIKKDFEAGKLNDFVIELEVMQSAKPIGMISNGMPEIDLSGMLDSFFPKKKSKKKITVKYAYEVLMQEESDKRLDLETLHQEAIRRAEEHGIIFIDEMDKIIGKSASHSGPDVSREGVQRDILPIVEGSVVSTKYGNIKTDFILFIAAGAFHIEKIEDMIPELQGRFPIRVELKNLTKDDFKCILSQPKNAVTVQYAALLKVDNIELEFTDDALDEIATLAEQENDINENLGARRLHTLLEHLLEDISFNASGNHEMLKVVVDKPYVKKMFSESTRKYDLKKYVL